MFMMQPHRRSNRRPRAKKNTEKSSKDFISAYIKANRIEAMPGKLWRESKKKEEDEDDELPHVDGFDYDKEMYMANDRYASMINDEIAEFIKEKIWNEAQERYANDEAEHKSKFDESKYND